MYIYREGNNGYLRSDQGVLYSSTSVGQVFLYRDYQIHLAIRRGRFIVPTADLSAPTGVRGNWLKCIIVPIADNAV